MLDDQNDEESTDRLYNLRIKGSKNLKDSKVLENMRKVRHQKFRQWNYP